MKDKLKVIWSTYRGLNWQLQIFFGFVALILVAASVQAVL